MKTLLIAIVLIFVFLETRVNAQIPQSFIKVTPLVYLNRFGEVRTNPYLIPRTRSYTNYYYEPKIDRNHPIVRLGNTRKEDIDLWSLEKLNTSSLGKEKGNLEPIKRESIKWKP